MLTHKDIEKIRKMYYEQHYTVTEITRILKISRNTCYKYLKFVNYNAYIKENKRAHYLDQYKKVLLSLIKKIVYTIINKHILVHVLMNI